MNYWEGCMNWELEQNWKCETCNEFHGLTWGLVHASCRCNNCHTNYRMRDEDSNVVTVPICQLKNKFKEPAKIGYEKYQKPITEFTDKDWDMVLV